MSSHTIHAYVSYAMGDFALFHSGRYGALVVDKDSVNACSTHIKTVVYHPTEHTHFSCGFSVFCC